MIRMSIKHWFFIILYYITFITPQFLYSFFTLDTQLVTISRFTNIIPCILTGVLFWRKNEFYDLDSFSFGVTTIKKLDRELFILNTIQVKALNLNFFVKPVGWWNNFSRSITVGKKYFWIFHEISITSILLPKTLWRNFFHYIQCLTFPKSPPPVKYLFISCSSENSPRHIFILPHVITQQKFQF